MQVRILLVWEMGQGLGHLGQLTGLGRELARRGHQVWYCYRWFHPRLPVDVARRVLQTPRISYGGERVRKPATFVDMLHNGGFGSAATLASAIRAWRELYALVGPEIVVFDFAPLALLAARELPVHRVQIGNGWYVPPLADPVPAYRDTDREDPDPGGIVETGLVERVNTVLADTGLAPLASLSRLYADVDRTLLTTLPEFDHFRRAENAVYTGPLPTILDAGADMSWPRRAGPRIFAYLKDFPSLRTLLRILAGGRYAVIVFAAGKAYEIARHFTGDGLVVSRSPLAMARMAEADLVIGHAGLGMTVEILRRGLPMLLLPQHQEQRINAANAVALGAALQPEAADSTPSRAEYARLVDQLLSDRRYRRAAENFAARYRHLEAEEQLARVAGDIERLAG